MLLAGAALAAPVTPLAPDASVDLLEHGALHAADAADAFPAGRAELAGWLAARPHAAKVDIFGGAYWLHAQVRHDGTATRWVLDPNNTIIERVEARLYGSDGSRQQLVTGYRAPHEHALHYGRDVQLAPGIDYDVLIRFESPYYASVPRFEVVGKAAYARKVLVENVVVLGALGAMAALGVFNLFVYALARTRSHLWYAGQMLTGCWAWAMVFHVPAELFGWHELRVHYVPFYLAAAFGSLFSIEFLALRERQPGLFNGLRALAVASFALAALSVFALPYAHGVATLVISAWITLALVGGVRSWRGGYRPARFFVLAFVAVLMPALIILPGNLDLVPDLVGNAELVTLVGTMLEGVLQAFALADRIRSLNAEKNDYSVRLVRALEVARTDALTGIGNRFAFGLALQEHIETRRLGEAEPHLLLAIDLDGLKLVNDCHGHARGDELIRTLADALLALTAHGGACFRLGGDEFAIFAPARDEERLAAGLAQLDVDLRRRGFEFSGVSYGIAHWGADSDDPAEMIRIADHNMYQHKTSRKRGRVLETPQAV
jgi:diguanylate cyclase (GGDEF)-like protein